MAVPSEAQHREIDQRALDERGVTGRFGGEIGRRSVERRELADGDAAQRGAQLGGRAAGSSGPMPTYSSSCRTVVAALGRRPAVACARSAAYIDPACDQWGRTRATASDSRGERSATAT